MRANVLTVTTFLEFTALMYQGSDAPIRDLETTKQQDFAS
jgi:hypothetical protein